METYKCMSCGKTWILKNVKLLPPEKINECRQTIQHRIINIKSLIKSRKVVSVWLENESKI